MILFFNMDLSMIIIFFTILTSLFRLSSPIKVDYAIAGSAVIIVIALPKTIMRKGLFFEKALDKK